jgi:hypothetical protein
MLSTNLIVAAASQREAGLSKDIVRNVLVPLESHVSGTSYADYACSLVKFTN